MNGSKIRKACERAVIFGCLLTAITACSTPNPYMDADTANDPVSIQEVTPAIDLGKPVVDPIRLMIPAIGVDVSPIVPLGLDKKNKHEVPPVNKPLETGWFQPGPEPGEPGSAIILGHINGGGQKGIFFNLKSLVSGDKVIVDDKTFTVYQVIKAPKTEFPAEIVYRESELPEITLITCGGELDATGHNYKDNIIVLGVMDTPRY